MHTLVIVNPGHFHAGLVLRRRHPELNRDVYIFSEGGSDLDNYMKLINAFNERADEPTDWIYHVYTGSDFLEKAASFKGGDIAVFAGRNDEKVHYLAAMHDAGYAILTDKPVTINSEGVAVLEKTLASGGKPVMDIMTGQYEPPAVLLRDLLLSKEIFGEFRADGDRPMIENNTVHHLYKNVNGSPLVRPAWYFDVNKQGCGLCDVATHLINNAQWMLYGDLAIDFDNEVELLDAKLWNTDVPADKFELITKTRAFPAELADRVENGVLKLACNGTLSARYRDVSVRINTQWNLEAPPGGGDMHNQVARGTVSDLFVEQGPQTGFKALVYAIPHTVSVTEMAERMKKLFAELGYDDAQVTIDGNRCIAAPPSAMVDEHEYHFALVRDDFLKMLATGVEPAGLRSQLLSKYKLMGMARDLALKK